MVRPGGTVVYAVCSLEPEEGPEQIAALCAAGAPVTITPLDPAEWTDFCGLTPAAITPDGALRTLPCHWGERGGMDGFYIVRLTKN
jgi:16S rRNA (cytosine967-C5)-methyltransferase